MLLAADVLRAAADLRMRVPADVSVVGLRATPAGSARRLTPPLTMVRQDVVAKGEPSGSGTVATIRARRMGHAAPARRHLLATELVLRETTAPPADAVHGTNGTFIGQREVPARSCTPHFMYTALGRQAPFLGAVAGSAAADAPAIGGSDAGEVQGDEHEPCELEDVTSSGPSDRPDRCSSSAMTNSTAATMAVMMASSKRW